MIHEKLINLKSCVIGINLKNEHLYRDLEGAMIHVLIGVAAASSFWIFLRFLQRYKLRPRWWQICLTVLLIFYSVFVLEVIVSFLSEGTTRGAIVMGVLLGFIAVVWSVLLSRFVFRRKESLLRVSAEKRKETL